MGAKSSVFLSALYIGKASTIQSIKWNKPPTPTQARKGVGVINNLVGLLQPKRKDIEIHEATLAQVPCWHIEGPTEFKRVIFYLHGGGYIFSLQHLSNFFRYFLPELSKACEAEVWAPDYRVAPEHPYPAAIEDAYAAYLALLSSGVNANNIFV